MDDEAGAKRARFVWHNHYASRFARCHSCLPHPIKGW